MKGWIVLVLVVLCSGFAFAATEDSEIIQQLEKKIQELESQLDALKQQTKADELEEIRRQLQILAAELEKLRSGEAEMELEDAKRRALGLGSAAATVYMKKHGVSIAGYGEMLYENFSDETEAGLWLGCSAVASGPGPPGGHASSAGESPGLASPQSSSPSERKSS